MLANRNLYCSSCEKDTIPKDNPRLTTTGLRRAQDLATLLKDKHISAVYSTNTVRTISTAHPTADEYHLPLFIYDSIPQLKESIPIRNDENILIVGHSNTILEIAKTFGTRPTLQSIDDEDFDNILIITRRRNIFGSSTTLAESTYGSSSP